MWLAIQNGIWKETQNHAQYARSKQRKELKDHKDFRMYRIFVDTFLIISKSSVPFNHS